MHTNHEHGRFHNPRISGLKLNSVTSVISSTFVIPNEGPTVWLFDGGASSRVVRLPASTLERQVVIANTGTAELNVTDLAGVALVNVAPQSLIMFFGGASRWVWISSSFASDEVSITNVVGSTALAATDIIVHVNSAGAVVLTLPASASWLAANGHTGLPLEIADISNAASTNNITINPAGAETIGGNASLTINTDSGSYQLRPKTAGGWTFR